MSIIGARAQALVAPLLSARNRHALAYVLERGSNLVFTFLSGIIVLRSLGPTAFAVYGMVISVAQVCVTFARLSLDEHYAFAYISKHASRRLTRTLIVQRAIIGAGLGAAIAALFGARLSIAGLAPALTVVAFCLLEALSVVEIQVQALSSFRWLSIVGVTRSVVGLLLRVILVVSGRGALGGLLVAVVAELIVFRVGLYLVFRLRRLDAARPVGPPGHAGEIAAFYEPRLLRGYLLTTLLALAYTRTELFFASAGLDQESLGTYLGAQRFVEVYSYLANVLGALLMGSIARLDENDIRPYLARTTMRMGALAAVLVLANVTVVPLVLPLVVGHKFPDLPRTFVVLSLVIVPLYLGTPSGKVLLSRGKTRVPIVAGVINVLTCVVCYLWMFPASMGSMRPALAMVIGNIIGGVLVVLGAWGQFGRPAVVSERGAC